ncbi:MAG: alpha/beta hydrolase [Eubacteriales bacterium]|nr:alpha/beta hydrolase [Eubacteriales bacterium]
MKKLAVIFPGVGYTCEKPLLYYTASAAADKEYEIVRLDYGQDIHSFRGRTPLELEPVIGLALKRSLRQLQNIRFQDYERILFISKSIGTVIACETQKQLALTGKVRHFLLTPIPATLPYLKQAEGVFFSGTADPYIPEKTVRQAARLYPSKTGGIFEGCNHSLERKGDTMGNLQNLHKVIECLEWILKEPLD